MCLITLHVFKSILFFFLPKKRCQEERHLADKYKTTPDTTYAGGSATPWWVYGLNVKYDIS